MSHKLTAKKAASKKSKMKTMFAVVETAIDFRDPEDSQFYILGVYASKKAAEAARQKASEEYENEPEGEEGEGEEGEEELFTPHSIYIDKVKVQV